jgi:hypothetical protein
MIGKLLGHTQPATTARYAHLAADPVRTAADLIGNEIMAVMSNGRAGWRRLRCGNRPVIISYAASMAWAGRATNGAKKTFESGTVRFSRPTEFNDPFDMSLKEALGAELEDFLSQFMKHFYEFVSSDIDCSILRPGQFKELIILINQGIKNRTSEQNDAFTREFLRTPVSSIYDLNKLRRINGETIDRSKAACIGLVFFVPPKIMIVYQCGHITPRLIKVLYCNFHQTNQKTPFFKRHVLSNTRDRPYFTGAPLSLYNTLCA